MYNKHYYPAKKFRWNVFPLYLIKEMLLGRRENKKDNVILVTGSRGDGKSTFTGKILFQFEDFDPYKQIIYSKDRMFELIRKKNGFVWGDEAVVNAAKGNVMSRANKMLHEIVTINRDNYNIVFFCIPFIEDFDSKILQYVSMWVHIDSRGLGVVMLPANKGIFGKKNWDINSMRKLYEEFQSENRNIGHIPYWVYPNFRGYIKFGKLTEQQQKIVDEIKFMRKNENLERQAKEEVVVQVKEVENYAKYSAKNLASLVAKGEIRNRAQFDINCKELQLDPDEMLKKCDSVLRHNAIELTTKQLLKKYEKEDAKFAF